MASRIKLGPTKPGAINSLPPKNPKRLGKNDSQNDDLEFVMDEPARAAENVRGIGKQRSMLNKKEHAQKRSTLVNAGMSASRKGLQEKDLSERSDAHSSFR